MGVIAIFGPTGVGKTDVAIALARRLRRRGVDPVAVSADALQVYAGLDVLTGVPTPEQRSALEHRLVAIVPLQERFSAGRYARMAHAEIDALLARGRLPLVVGGTGLYLRAALADLDLRPAPPPALRARWLAELDRRGVAALHSELAQRAPEMASRLHPNDRQRIVRALELHELGERQPRGPDSQLWDGETRHPTRLIGLVMARAALYQRIDARVDAMIAAGAVEQVRAAQAAGASDTARRALGFDELLSGDVEAMKRRTRNYARRQLTWLRKLPGVELVDVTGRDPDQVAAELDRKLDRADAGRLT
jgi:tRNA dimethylallyltransferase